jgi:PPOX class probable F420-dependent enzyme
MTSATSPSLANLPSPNTNGATGVTPRPEPLNSLTVVIIGLLAGGATLVAGLVALTSPSSYRDMVELSASDAFVQVAGGFQVGLGISLLLALFWREALTTVMAGSFVGGLAATIVYAGADDSKAAMTAALAAFTLLMAVGFVARYRRQGLIVGDSGQGAADPALVPFVRQKTVLLTSYKRDGSPVGTPLSVAVDGDRAYARTFTNAYKVKRIERNPKVELAPCNVKGNPSGPGVAAVARRVDGEEYRHAGRLLRRKYPLVHGVLVPFAHKVLARKKSGPTVHLVLRADHGEQER